MKRVHKLVILYCLVTMISGCGLIIEKMIPGSISKSHESIITHETSENIEIPAQENDIKSTTKYMDHSSTISSKSADSDYSISIETTNQKKDTISDDSSAPSRTIDIDPIRMDDYDVVQDFADYQQNKSTTKTILKSDQDRDETFVQAEKPDCTGEKVSTHWHDLKNVVVVTDVLNIRSNYGMNQPVIGEVERCEQLVVIDKHVERIKGNKRIKSRGWLKIKTQSGTTGWVAGWLTRYINN